MTAPVPGKTIHELTDVVVSQHDHEPASPDTPTRLERFEEVTGYALPVDLRAFYLRIHCATLFERYQLLPVEELRRTGAALQGDEWADSEPVSWYAFCDACDGDHVGIDLNPSPSGGNWILDCDHNDVSSRRVIADSFTEFLNRVLAADGQPYYLGSEFRPLATVGVPYRPPVAWLRRHYERWSHDPEVGPETCVEDGCARLRVISLSVHCRRHHFESINRLAYPFDD